MEFVKLNDGNKMPIAGFGTFQLTDKEVCKKAVLDALKVGYRLIDTAESYANEEFIGEAIKESGIPREEIFVTTKVFIYNAGYEKCKKAIDVWIGRKARIMPGVTIGDGAIIGGYSVVTKVVPPYSVVAGTPAKIVKTRFDDETIAFLEEIKWWDFEDSLLEETITFVTTLDIENDKTKLRELYEKNQDIKSNKKIN